MKADENAFICGPTGCGKSHLARTLARADLARGLPVLVCSPRPDPWPCTAQTDDIERFRTVIFAIPSCTAIIDDAQSLIGKDAAEKLDLANRIRQPPPNFRRSIFTVQDPFDLDRRIRQNCSTFFLFFTRDEHAKRLWERHFEVPGLSRKISSLKFREFLKIEAGPMQAKVSHFLPLKNKS